MSGNSSRGCVGHLISRAKTTLRRECPNRQRLPSCLGGVLMMGVGVGSRASPPSCTTIRTGSGRPRWSRQPGRPAASGTSSACSAPSASGRCARAGAADRCASSRRRGSWWRRWGAGGALWVWPSLIFLPPGWRHRTDHRIVEYELLGSLLATRVFDAAPQSSPDCFILRFRSDRKDRHAAFAYIASLLLWRRNTQALHLRGFRRFATVSMVRSTRRHQEPGPGG